MRYYGKKSMAGALEIILNCTLIVGIIAALSIVYNTAFNFEHEIGLGQKTLIMILLITGVICVCLMVIQLKRVIATLVKGNPFVIENVKALKKIALECFIISLCYLVNFFINLNFKEFKFIYIDSNGIHTDMEFIIFVFAGCFLLILSKVFDQAVKYKEENDFTI